MKKISLKNLKNELSRSEMRSLLGGRPQAPNPNYPSCGQVCISDWGCGTSDGCPNCRVKADNPQEGICRSW